MSLLQVMGVCHPPFTSSLEEEEKLLDKQVSSETTLLLKTTSALENSGFPEQSTGGYSCCHARWDYLPMPHSTGKGGTSAEAGRHLFYSKKASNMAAFSVSSASDGGSTWPNSTGNRKGLCSLLPLKPLLSGWERPCILALAIVRIPEVSCTKAGSDFSAQHRFIISEGIVHLPMEALGFVLAFQALGRQWAIETPHKPRI